MKTIRWVIWVIIFMILFGAVQAGAEQGKNEGYYGHGKQGRQVGYIVDGKDVSKREFVRHGREQIKNKKQYYENIKNNATEVESKVYEMPDGTRTSFLRTTEKRLPNGNVVIQGHMEDPSTFMSVEEFEAQEDFDGQEAYMQSIEREDFDAQRTHFRVLQERQERRDAKNKEDKDKNKSTWQSGLSGGKNKSTWQSGLAQSSNVEKEIVSKQRAISGESDEKTLNKKQVEAVKKEISTLMKAFVSKEK